MRAFTSPWELMRLLPGSLQQACGFEYTSKLQRMFQDIGVSKDLNEQFKKHLTNSEPLDCEYHVLAGPFRAALREASKRWHIGRVVGPLSRIQGRQTRSPSQALYTPPESCVTLETQPWTLPASPRACAELSWWEAWAAELGTTSRS